MSESRTWLKVQPDTVWLPTEVRERFSAPADMLLDKDPVSQQTLLAIYAYPTIRHAIDLYERARHWKFLDRVPAKKPTSAQACCQKIMQGKAGDPLPLRFEISPFQGDTDDAENTGEATDASARWFTDGLMDWVAILHFLQPAILVDGRAMAEEQPGQESGFMPYDLLPYELQAVIKEHKNHGGRI